MRKFLLLMAEQRTALIFRATRRLLRPLVRFLISQQITYTDFSKLLKEVFVSVAYQDFKIEDQTQTDSRLSLLTGIHRKEVKKLREAAQAEDSTPVASSVTAQLIAAWLSDPYCVDKKGKPYSLPPYGPVNEKTQRGTFESLVNQISKGNLRAATVLNECIRLDVVELNETGDVCVKVDAFVPSEDFSDQIYFFENNLSSHISACCHNLQGEGTPFFERSLAYNYLSKEDLNTFKALMSKEGMDLLKTANKQAKVAQKKFTSQSNDENKDAQRITIGLYYYHEPMMSERAPDE